MLSPFPGMDPYLEEPGLWPDVHHQLISVARERLNEQIAPKYFARLEERVYIADEDDPDRKWVVPDIHIAERRGRAGPAPASGAAILDVVEPVRIRSQIPPEIHEARIEIRDRGDRTIVAVIEVVSPANKIGGTRGRESFERKRTEIMASASHWVEIDLLRGGSALTPRWGLRPHHYLVHVSRVEDRPDGLAWPIALSQTLPVVPIPLRRGDPDAQLDLQDVLATSYRRASYEFEIDYAKPPVPPLEDTWAEWADRLLREKELR